MKRVPICLLAIGLFFQSHSIAQIRSVSLQASGLTCSMCSRAIYKSLLRVPAVSKVEEDIAHSSYHIQFDAPEKVSLENLKKAVIDAGFSVAWMEVRANFDHVDIISGGELNLSDHVFQFVDTDKQNLNGERTLLIIDRDYMLEKDRKKYPGSYELKPGAGGEKIFHVTIQQS